MQWSWKVGIAGGVALTAAFFVFALQYSWPERRVLPIGSEMVVMETGKETAQKDPEVFRFTLPVQPDKATSTIAEPERPPQFVVLAFDGSRSLPMWNATRQFAKELEVKGVSLKFTYFINSVYLLTEAHRMLYQPPAPEADGSSKIGFASSEKELMDRIAHINGALEEGHEIGSHLNGHFDGSKWKEDDWRKEFTSFYQLVFHAQQNNEIKDRVWQINPLKLVPKDIAGFRAPNLATTSGLWPVLNAFGYRYDTSRVAKPDVWPKKTEQGIWEFPVAGIFDATRNRTILAMDYNFYVAQSGAKDITTRDTKLWEAFFNEMLNAYTEYFQKNYQGNRAPIFIGHHFSEWNGGVYWDAMKRFAENVCGLPEVKCVTYSELADYLDTHPNAESIAQGYASSTTRTKP